MRLSGSGITYAFLVIPLLFAMIVVIQGLQKIIKNEPDGHVALGFGALFLVLIIAAYFLFIQ